MTTCGQSNELNNEGIDGWCLLKGHRKEKGQGESDYFEYWTTYLSATLFGTSAFCEMGLAFSSFEMKKLSHSGESTAHFHVAGTKAVISSGVLAFPSTPACLWSSIVLAVSLWRSHRGARYILRACSMHTSACEKFWKPCLVGFNCLGQPSPQHIGPRNPPLLTPHAPAS